MSNYRQALHKKLGQGFYSGPLHFGFTSGLSLLAIIWTLSKVHDLSWQEFLIVPFTFLYANFVEYFSHKYPMHRKTRGLGIIFERHTVEHHHFFTHKTMSIDTLRDFRIVLFPALFIVFLLGAVAAPLGFVLHQYLTPNAAYLFVATGLSYYLNYECFHLFYHLSEKSLIGRLPFMARLRRHHTRHHDTALMSRYNFNITWPICDWLFGTLK